MKIIKILTIIFFLSFFYSCIEKLEKETLATYPDGSPMKERYYKWKGDDKYLVKEVRYFPNGEKEMEGEINQDLKRHGLWISWHKNGEKWSEGNFKNGIKDGEFLVWYKSGNKNYESNYKMGIPEGEWDFYNDNGDLIKTINYKDGKEIKSK